MNSSMSSVQGSISSPPASAANSEISSLGILADTSMSLADELRREKQRNMALAEALQISKEQFVKLTSSLEQVGTTDC